MGVGAMAAAPHPAPTLQRTTIAAGDRGHLVNFHELWSYRELLAFLAWRDVRIRYRQTVLGVGWALLEPLASVVMLTLVFNRLAGIDSGDIPYPIFCYVAVTLWTFFARSLRAVTNCPVANAGLLTKVYFPRLIMPLAAQSALFIDAACALGMLTLFLVCFGVPLTWTALTVPVWILLASMNALGLGLLLAAINVRFRDVSQGVPFLVQVWMFATPVAYPLAKIPDQWQGLYTLNPMVGVVEAMRWALLPDYAWNPHLLVPSLIVGGGLLLIGLRTFRASQRRFADIV